MHPSIKMYLFPAIYPGLELSSGDNRWNKAVQNSLTSTQYLFLNNGSKTIDLFNNIKSSAVYSKVYFLTTWA